MSGADACRACQSEAFAAAEQIFREHALHAEADTAFTLEITVVYGEAEAFAGNQVGIDEGRSDRDAFGLLVDLVADIRAELIPRDGIIGELAFRYRAILKSAGRYGIVGELALRHCSVLDRARRHGIIGELAFRYGVVLDRARRYGIIGELAFRHRAVLDGSRGDGIICELALRDRAVLNLGRADADIDGAGCRINQQARADIDAKPVSVNIEA